jgi:hypothetical protein
VLHQKFRLVVLLTVVLFDAVCFVAGGAVDLQPHAGKTDPYSMIALVNVPDVAVSGSEQHAAIAATQLARRLLLTLPLGALVFVLKGFALLPGTRDFLGHCHLRYISRLVLGGAAEGSVHDDKIELSAKAFQHKAERSWTCCVYRDRPLPFTPCGVLIVLLENWWEGATLLLALCGDRPSRPPRTLISAPTHPLVSS